MNHRFTSCMFWRLPWLRLSQREREQIGMLTIHSQLLAQLWLYLTRHFSERDIVLSVFFFFNIVELFIFFFYLNRCFILFFTLQYCIGFAVHQHESATGEHVFLILNPPPTSLPIPSLWVIPVHQPQASCILHWAWTCDSFLIWYYTCFNAILPNHPTLSLSHRVQKMYICVSIVLSYTGLSLPSF